MTHQEDLLVARLCEVESPRDMNDWKGQDGHYVAACRVTAKDVPGLIRIALKWPDLDWPGDVCPAGIDPEDAVLMPVTAWRTLADLKADAAVDPLIDMLRELDDEFDDWASEELPHVFGKIGEPAIESLTRLAKDARAEDFVRSIAARGLRCVADYHPHTRDRIVACLTEMMSSAAAEDIEFNSTLLVGLVELQAVEAAEPIERAFAGNLVDVGMMGTWEDVRRELGVEGLGLEMPENPHNSIDRIRTAMGVGIFSKDPVYMHGDIDHDAEQAYLDRARDTFSKSIEARRVIDRYDNLGWSGMLLEFGVNYLGEIVDQMTLESVTEFVLDYVPRKVSTGADAAESIVYELAMFWKYLDRVYELPEAKSIVEWLSADDLVALLETELSDASNFGMAKSMFAQGADAGYDMTSEEGLAEFMMAYNQSLQAEPAPTEATPTPTATAPVVNAQRVGRNDLCPCGSGKKFKKCCR